MALKTSQQTCAIGHYNASKFWMHADKEINVGIVEINFENVILLNHENICSIETSDIFKFINFLQFKTIAIDFPDFFSIKTS